MLKWLVRESAELWSGDGNIKFVLQTILPDIPRGWNCWDWYESGTVQRCSESEETDSYLLLKHPNIIGKFYISLQANAGCLGQEKKHQLELEWFCINIYSLPCVDINSGRRWLLPICVTHTCERYWSRFLAVLNKTLHHPLTQ